MSNTNKEKTLYFYFINMISDQPYSDISDSLSEIDLSYEHKDYSIKILNNNFDDQSIFGMYSTKKELDEMSGYLENKKDGTKLQSEEYIFNTFTYFYIDCTNKYLTFINSQDLPKFDRILEYILKKRTNSIVQITPLAVPDLNKSLTLIEKGLLTFSPTATQSTFFNIKDKYGPEFTLATVNMNYKRFKGESLETVLSKFKNNKKAKLVVQKGLNKGATYDLVSHVLTKKSTIRWSKKITDNHTRLRNLLCYELKKAVES